MARALATLEGVWAPVLSPAEIGEDPQAIANGYLPDVDKGDGRVYRGIASPARFDGVPSGRSPAHPSTGSTQRRSSSSSVSTGTTLSG